MKKLLVVLMSIAALRASFDSFYAGCEGRYEYHNYLNSLQLDKHVSIHSKSKSHQKIVPGIFIGKNFEFGRNYIGTELKLLAPVSQRKTFTYEDEDINVSFKRGVGSMLSFKGGMLISDNHSIYLKPTVLIATYTSKNSFKNSKRKIRFIPSIGTERLINDKCIARLEYEYMPPVFIRSTKNSITHNHGENVHVISVGIAYKI